MPLTDYMSQDVATGFGTGGTTNYGSGGFMEAAKGIFSDATDILGQGIETWLNFEEARAIRDGYGQSQATTRDTVSTPSGYTTQSNPATGTGLPLNLTGQQLLIAGGVVLLAVYLMR